MKKSKNLWLAVRNFSKLLAAGAVPGRGVWGVGVVGCALAAEDHVSLVLEVDARGPPVPGSESFPTPLPLQKKAHNSLDPSGMRKN